MVWATASFDNSHKEYLTQEDFNSLENALRGAKHLNENILKIEPLKQSNRKFRTGQFKHTLELKLLVKTENLSENTITYIWRNLGQQIWTKSNGTKVSLICFC